MYVTDTTLKALELIIIYVYIKKNRVSFLQPPVSYGLLSAEPRMIDISIYNLFVYLCVHKKRLFEVLESIGNFFFLYLLIFSYFNLIQENEEIL